MQFYLMMAISTFVIAVLVLHIVNRMNDGELFDDTDNYVPAGILCVVAGVLWFIVWPCLIIGLVCYVLIKVLDKVFLRKYLKKEKPDA